MNTIGVTLKVACHEARVDGIGHLCPHVTEVATFHYLFADATCPMPTLVSVERRTSFQLHTSGALYVCSTLRFHLVSVLSSTDGPLLSVFDVASLTAIHSITVITPTTTWRRPVLCATHIETQSAQSLT